MLSFLFFQVNAQDRHHMVSLRRPAVRPQVWLLDLLWLAGHGDDDGDDGCNDGDLVDARSPSSRSIGSVISLSS